MTQQTVRGLEVWRAASRRRAHAGLSVGRARGVARLLVGVVDRTVRTRTKGLGGAPVAGGPRAQRSQRHSLAPVLEGQVLAVVQRYARRSRARPGRSCGRRPRVLREAAESMQRGGAGRAPRDRAGRGLDLRAEQRAGRSTIAAAHSPRHTAQQCLGCARTALWRRAARRRPWPVGAPLHASLTAYERARLPREPGRSSSSWRCCGRCSAARGSDPTAPRARPRSAAQNEQEGASEGKMNIIHGACFNEGVFYAGEHALLEPAAGEHALLS